MAIEYRPITADEFAAFNLTTSMAFGRQDKPEEAESFRGIFELDRSIAAFDGDRIVGTGEIFSYELTLPGPTIAPAGGVSWIGVLPTHTRRGILTEIMRRQMRDMQERSEPLGILYSSESLIYGRFGYGLATLQNGYEIDTRHAGLEFTWPTLGQVRFIDREQAGTILPEVYERFRRLQPGSITRSEAWWELYLSDPESWREGLSARFSIVYEAPEGGIEGFATYRIKNDWPDGFANHKLFLTQLITLTPEARTALWRYCLEVDLVQTVATFGFPMDEPLRWMLRDPRRLRVSSTTDALWVRIIDVPKALCARRYMTSDRLVFDVHDHFLPENTGRYVLEGSAEGATCKATTDEPDISLRINDLGATYLGGCRFNTLVQAGRVQEHTPGAVYRADSMFASDPAPWVTTDF